MIKKKLHRLKQRIIWYYQKFTFDPHFYWEKNGGRKYFNSFHTSKSRNEDQFLDYIGKYKPKRIIDIGCGYGRYLKSIRNEFPNIELYGSDISHTQIKYAKKYLSSYNVNLFVSDSTKFNFQDNFFDLSIGYSIWEHIPYKNFEIIIVNDGSDQKEYYEQKFPSEVKQIDLNPGLKNIYGFPTDAVRNKGVEIADGKYLAFLDDDDIWMEEKLSLQVELLENSKYKFSKNKQ